MTQILPSSCYIVPIRAKIATMLTSPLFLVGFMACGKTTLGATLAKTLLLPFVDTDDILEQHTGKTPAQWLLEDKESFFRHEETTILSMLCLDSTPRIIATGGGLPANLHHMNIMRHHGLVIYLQASCNYLNKRYQTSTIQRPLFPQNINDLQTMYNKRHPIYRQAHSTIATDNKTIEQIIAMIQHLLVTWNTMTSHVTSQIVSTTRKTYPVIFDEVSSLSTQITLNQFSKIGIISDSCCDTIYGKRLRDHIEQTGATSVTATVPTGESHKTIETAMQVASLLIEQGIDRNSMIIIMGGGLVGDLGGFVSSILFRGLPFLQIPTSLLAMIDASIGGKNGVNTSWGKNIVGTITQPSLVIVDQQLLTTLSRQDYQSGFGELIKYALIDSESFFVQLHRLAPMIANKTVVPTDLTNAIQHAVAMKTSIVSIDEHDTHHDRCVLNLGHTIGHALEAEHQYKDMPHGIAVGLGLLAAARISFRLGICDTNIETSISALLASADMPHHLDKYLTESMWSFLCHDKKRINKSLRFVALKNIGTPVVTNIPLKTIKKHLFIKR